MTDYRIVPVEPTEEMVRQAAAALVNAAAPRSRFDPSAHARLAYAAMLSAAPTVDLREKVARALHARYEERARQRGQVCGDGHTLLGGARLEDCSHSLRQSFLEDADTILALFGEGE